MTQRDGITVSADHIYVCLSLEHLKIFPDLTVTNEFYMMYIEFTRRNSDQLTRMSLSHNYMMMIESSVHITTGDDLTFSSVYMCACLQIKRISLNNWHTNNKSRKKKTKKEHKLIYTTEIPNKVKKKEKKNGANKSLLTLKSARALRTVYVLCGEIGAGRVKGA